MDINFSENLKIWKEQNQDENIISALRSRFYLNHGNFKRGQNLKERTMFSNLQDENLIETFEHKQFNELHEYQLTHLFQEVHNRVVKGENKEVSRDVIVEDYVGTGTVYGSACASTDVLFLNNGLIESAKKAKEGKLNKKSIGTYMLDTVIHETRHIVQYEYSFDVINNKDIDDKSKFIGAMSLINHINKTHSSKNYSNIYEIELNQNYANNFLEHDANTFAMNKMIEFNKQNKNQDVFNEYVKESVKMTLHFEPSENKEEQLDQIETRVFLIEDCIKRQINYFKTNINDCELKQKLEQVLDDYIKLDENRNSKLRAQLTQEITYLVNQYSLANQRINEKNNSSFLNNLLSKFK